MTSDSLIPITEQTDTEAAIQFRSLTVGNPVLFSQLTLPVGIATDLQGNVFVGYEDFGGALAVFNPSGTAIGRIQLSPLISPVDLYSNARLALDPSSGQILALFPAGSLKSINPSTGAITPLLDLKQLSIRTDRVYDIAQGGIVNATAQIQPALANYGDIAVFSGNGFTDLYISGLSASFPFVMRLRFTQAGLSSADVLVSSIASAAPNQGQPPGVAVNSQGTVLTTLPVPNSNATGNFNVPVFFPTDLDPHQGTGSFVPQVIGIDIASIGMTTDTTGNFYIATSAVGTSLGGTAGSGAVVVLSPTLQVLNVLPIAQSATLASNDVAVNPTGDRLYVTFNNTLAPSGGVALFPIASTQDVLTRTSSTSQWVGTEVDESLMQSLSDTQVNRSEVSPLEEQSLGQLAMSQLNGTATNAWQSGSLDGLISSSHWTANFTSDSSTHGVAFS